MKLFLISEASPKGSCHCSLFQRPVPWVHVIVPYFRGQSRGFMSVFSSQSSLSSQPSQVNKRSRTLHGWKIGILTIKRSYLLYQKLFEDMDFWGWGVILSALSYLPPLSPFSYSMGKGKEVSGSSAWAQIKVWGRGGGGSSHPH